jgi:hypothetical protein
MKISDEKLNSSNNRQTSSWQSIILLSSVDEIHTINTKTNAVREDLRVTVQNNNQSCSQ